MNLIIIYAIALQLITAAFLLFSSTPLRVASLGIFYNFFIIPEIGALLMLVGVILSTAGLFIPRQNRLRFLFFLLQYLFLVLTAGSSLNYIAKEMYADGVVRPWQFIFIDQLPYLIIVILYTMKIFDFRKGENGTKIG